MGKSRVSKMNGYRSMVSRQKNDVFKFKPKKKKERVIVCLKQYWLWICRRHVAIADFAENCTRA